MESSNYKVFYNEDCSKYGVQELINDYRGEHWHQVLNIRGEAYTKYKKVAERWMQELINK